MYRNPEEFTKIMLELRNELRNVVVYKIGIQKPN